MNKDDFNHSKYFDRKRAFHIVKGCGTGSVTLLIRKNLSTWLYRLFRFGETSRYVLDSRGIILVYNHISELVAILDRKRKVHAKYETHAYSAKEWSWEKYNTAWDGKMYSIKSVTQAELRTDPYCFWVKGYKAHFVLEQPTKKRQHFAYYRPVKKSI